MAMSNDSIAATSGGLFSQFRIQRKLKPQNYPVQNQLLQRLGNERLHVSVASMQGFRYATRRPCPSPFVDAI